MQHPSELAALEEQLESIDHFDARCAFHKAHVERLKALRNEDAAQNPSGFAVSACKRCGSIRVLNDANARYNPVRGEMEFVSEFDDTFCQECQGECSVYDRNLSQAELARDFKDSDKTRVEFDSRELAAVLTGLRLLQSQHCALSVHLTDILTDGGSFNPLDLNEIDSLCETLNA